MTYQQEQANKWQMRRKEKGSQIVKLVELSPREAAKGGADSNGGQSAEQGGKGQRRAFALKRYTVFNAQQIDGAPELPPEPALDFDPTQRADAVIAALKE